MNYTFFSFHSWVKDFNFLNKYTESAQRFKEPNKLSTLTETQLRALVSLLLAPLLHPCPLRTPVFLNSLLRFIIQTWDGNKNTPASTCLFECWENDAWRSRKRLVHPQALCKMLNLGPKCIEIMLFWNVFRSVSIAYKSFCSGASHSL